MRDPVFLLLLWSSSIRTLVPMLKKISGSYTPEPNRLFEQVLIGTRLLLVRFVSPGGTLVNWETPGKTVGGLFNLVLCRTIGLTSQWLRSSVTKFDYC